MREEFVIEDYVIPKRVYFVVLQEGGAIPWEPIRVESLINPGQMAAAMFTEELHAERAWHWWSMPRSCCIAMDEPFELIKLLESYRDKLGIHYVAIDPYIESERNAPWYEIDRFVGVLNSSAEGDE